MRQLDTENGDYDLTGQQTVLTHTPDANNPSLCQGFVLFGDGAKDLDGSGGDFEITVTITPSGGQEYTVEPDPQTITFSTSATAAIFTVPFPVPANAAVKLKAKSPNAGDSDVDVTAYLYDVVDSDAIIAGVAQVHDRTEGTVWFVSPNGNDANSGLTPTLAKQTAKTVIEATSAGDTVVLLQGTHALGNNIITVPDDVCVRGIGIDATAITSTASLLAKGCIVKPGNNTAISDLTIWGTLTDGTYQACIGAGSSQSGFNRVTVQRVRLRADTDCLYLACAEESCSWIVTDCILEAKYDAVAQSGNADHATIIRHSLLISAGPSAAGGGDTSDGIVLAAGTIRVEESRFHITDGGATRTVGAYVSGGTLTLLDCQIRTSGSTGTIKDIWQSSTGVVAVAGCQYDRSKLTGSVTDVARVLTDTSGYAYPEAAAIRTAIGLASANLDTQLSAISGYVDCLPASLNDLDAAGIRSAVGLALANLDTQLADIPTASQIASQIQTDLDAAHGSGSWEGDAGGGPTIE